MFLAGATVAVAPSVMGNPFESNALGASVAPGATVTTVGKPCSLNFVTTSPDAEAGETGDDGDDGG